MRILDLLRMSSSSLWKRKFRTVLTVLGVVIGTASIVVMISLGLGLNKATMDQIEEYGGLTTVTVHQSGYYGYYESSGSSTEIKYLDDELIEQLTYLEHVESIYPVLSVDALGKYGAYTGYLNIRGMSADALAELNINIGEGTLPAAGEELSFFYGNQVATNFYNEKTGESPYWSTGELPVDFMTDTVFIIFDTNAYYSSLYGSSDGTNTVAAPKKYLIPTSGVEKPNDENSWSSHGYYVYCEIDALKTTLKRVFKNKAIPGQPTTASGKPFKELYYSELQVNVDELDNVKEVQEAIQGMGYEAYSNAEWVESTQKQYANIQAILGGIGAVSLLVAAIGITNTMMMSIYERTKEIGVMKVLGCDMRNIQAMFLVEAGYIGLIGGILGLAFSYGISAIINKLVAASGNMSTLSYIPPWLAGMSVVFAVVIGMVAGFFPSRRAMKLSPLAAIRNE